MLRALEIGQRQSIRNVKDAQSLVETADGAINEISQIVQRMRELGVKASNGTYTDESNGSGSDTFMMQKEMDELKKQLNDIVSNTQFNTKHILKNENVSKYIYENRAVSKSISVIGQSKNRTIAPVGNYRYSDTLSAVEITENFNLEKNIMKQTAFSKTHSNNISTVVDYRPRWSQDGEKIIFSSTRDNKKYVTSKDINTSPEVNLTETEAPQKTITDNLLFRLRRESDNLIIEKRNNDFSGWNTLNVYSDYNINDGDLGYSFSPSTDTSGITSFVYSDTQGNVKKVDLDMNSSSVTGAQEVNSTIDTLNIPPIDNTVQLDYEPNLYRMNDSGDKDSLIIEKINDHGRRKLKYWDGSGSAPIDGYYTVSGKSVTFYDDAIIGNEPGDDGSDYYSVSYVSDGSGSNRDRYAYSIPSSAEIYNMHGEDGPRSLNIIVGDKTVEKSELLNVRPSDIENTHGVYVDEVSNKIEFYGNLRPANDEVIKVQYFYDDDTRNGEPSINVSKYIDTYNIVNPDLNTNRSLRVNIDGTELKQSETDGYTYDKSSGRVIFHGDSRPDLPSDTKITIDYIIDYSLGNTSEDVFGIPLTATPEIYNLGDTTAPQSIIVMKNASEEIPYSNINGFKYNQDKNQIELYGTSRPDVGDIYKIKLVREIDIGPVNNQNGVVEVPLTKTPETYNISDPTVPETFQVIVDGNPVSYDESKTNGFVYNSINNTIELYGDSRPKAGYPNDITVNYVYEQPYVNVGNETYDFKLNSSLDYGLIEATNPKAIRVYKDGSEIPYSNENGFTFDQTSQQLSLHGSFKPNKDDLSGDYKVYYVKEEDLQMNIPSDKYVYKVTLNGKEISEAENPIGNGYIQNGETVEVIGNERIDISKNLTDIKLDVSYASSLSVELNDTITGDYTNAYCDHEQDKELLKSDIDPDSLIVKLDGIELPSDNYSLEGNKIILNKDKIHMNIGDHNIDVDYNMRYAEGYESNKYIFQVGPSANETLSLEIASFNNLLVSTNIICVRTHEDAQKGMKVLDKVLDFVSRERGNIGAIENTLDTIANNLSVMEENTVNALSRIEDVDIAKEVMNKVKFEMLNNVQQALSSIVIEDKKNILKLLE